LRRDDLAAARAAPAILCNSHFSAESIRRAYGTVAEVCYLGVDPDLFTLGEQARHDMVLNVGGFEEFKGQHVVVQAIGRLPARRRPSLTLVYERADAGYRRRVLDLARELGVSVTEHQSVDDETLAGLYRSARATVLAATLEPFGLTMLESMASGTPVIAVKEGGFREVVADGVNGFLVERDVGRLADALQALAGDGVALEPGAVRRSILPFWTWHEAAQRQVDAMRRAVDRGRG
jgi:glycosyltransferase involved in cell wall biosynthesis